ncbi:transcriptional repressor general negative regulator of transcription subunit 4, partial [Podila horticola]
MLSDDDDFDCPLCMEELDISDRNFRPCPCGYQICRFCWHHIKEDLNGRCPACRRIYSEETVEFTPISTDELAMIKNEKKAKEREKKEIEAMSRKHLSNMRVVQKSLVYVIGLPTKLANDEHTLRQHEYFGQYGKISKVVINRRNTPMPSAGALPNQASLGVYITYSRKEDAAKAIAAIDGSIWDGKILRASYTKEDLAVGKHHLQEHMGPFDPYSHKPSVLGRPPLPSQSSSSSLTPRPKPATVASYHSATSSLCDWPAPGERSNGNDDDKDEGSALPATASWAKIGSNPSTPILHSSSPLSRKLDPPPLRSKGSTASIITGIVVNNGKRKEVNYAKDGSVLDSPVVHSPTPAEALAIEAAAKQQLLLEQRQQQEQLRKMQEQQRKQQQKQEEEAELQAELLQQKLKKQRQLELEQQQIELQKVRQQQEMDAKLQKQREKEQQRREQLRRENLQKEKEKEARSLQEWMEREEREEKERQDTIRKEREQKAAEEKAALLKARRVKEEQELKEQLALKEQQEKERQLREEQERIEQERLEKERAEQERVERERAEQERVEQERVERERAEKERIEQERAEQERVKKERAEKEREERERQERAEEEARLAQIQEESTYATQSKLSLGSFSFNPDASLSTLPYSYGQPNTATTVGETPPGFGLGNFAAYSGMPVTPSHYTGSFNPFSLDDEPLMRRPMAPPARSFLDDADYSPATDRNRPVGPPIPGKPRQTSRFGFASDNEHGDSFGRESYPDPSYNMQSMQDGFRALFPNVN